MVRLGEYWRTTNRSPRAATAGRSSRSCASALAPAFTLSPSSSTSRPMISLAPRWNRTRVLAGHSRGPSASSSKRTSSVVEAFSDPGATSQHPRSTSSRSTPCSATAVRWPASAASTVAPCTCTRRTRTVRPSGSSSSVSPIAMRPRHSVPVTTVPKPSTVNTRSTGRRAGSSAARLGSSASAASRAASSSGVPAPVTALNSTMGAAASAVPASSAATSLRTSATHSASTRSRLVSTTMPRFTPSSRTMARCSRVCGITPSSAAITSSTRSMPPTPASMFFTNRSCPGTSTSPTRTPAGVTSGAKPRSMLMPRFFSSGRRSVSTPVRRRTIAVLP